MIDSANVLLTTARALGLRVLLRKVRRQPQGISENGNSNGLVVATVYHLRARPMATLLNFSTANSSGS